MPNEVVEMTERLTGMQHTPLIIEETNNAPLFSALVGRDRQASRNAAQLLSKKVRERFAYVSRLLASRLHIQAILNPIHKPPKPPQKDMTGKIESYMANIDSIFIAQSWPAVRKGLEESRSDRVAEAMRSSDDWMGRAKALTARNKLEVNRALIQWFGDEITSFTEDQNVLFLDSVLSNGLSPVGTDPSSIRKNQQERTDILKAGNAHHLLALHLTGGYGTAMNIIGHLTKMAFDSELLSDLSPNERMKLVRKNIGVAAMLAYLPKPLIIAIDSQKFLADGGFITYRSEDAGLLHEVNYATLERFFERFMENNKGIDVSNPIYLFKILKQKEIHGCPALPSALRPFYNLYCDDLKELFSQNP